MSRRLSSAESATQCFKYGNLCIYRLEAAQEVTAPWDLIVPAAMYIMTGQDLTDKEKGHRNCLKKVNFLQASKVLCAVVQQPFWVKKL